MASGKPVDLQVRNLSLTDVPRAAKTQNDAFASDPFMRYIFETPDKQKASPLFKLFALIQVPLYWTLLCLVGGAISVDHGKAVAAYFLPVSNRPLLKYVKQFTGFLHVIRRSFGSPEQKRRHTEFRTKLKQSIEDTLGHDQENMLSLEVLATSPKCQGKGYGSALVKAITTTADSGGKAICLISSNISNTPFYNFHGFVSAAEIVLGDDNPTWEEKPVIVTLMVRPSRQCDEKGGA